MAQRQRYSHRSPKIVESEWKKIICGFSGKKELNENELKLICIFIVFIHYLIIIFILNLINLFRNFIQKSEEKEAIRIRINLVPKKWIGPIERSWIMLVISIFAPFISIFLSEFEFELSIRSKWSQEETD